MSVLYCADIVGSLYECHVVIEVTFPLFDIKIKMDAH